MIRHLFKLIWNRKRVNALIMLEICISFIVLAVTATAIAFHVINYRKPIGFVSERVWRVWPDSKLSDDRKYRETILAGRQTLYDAMRQLPEIESIATSTVTPYSTSTWTTSWGKVEQGNFHRTEVGLANDDAATVFGLHLIQGRWFDKSDDAAVDPPLVISQRLAQEVFGSRNPLGEKLDTGWLTRGRVVGVIDEFRKGGEFGMVRNFTFSRQKLTDTSRASVELGFVIKVRPGTTAAFQSVLAKVLAQTQPTWSFDIESIEHAREENFQIHLAPLVAFSLIAVFLLLMVGLGLIGVLWQNVTQRTREIGVRRALGGTADMLYRQILGELLVITTLGVTAGTLVVIQVPILNLLDFVTPNVYFLGLGSAFVLIYVLTLLCGLYPSWLAMDIHPSEALHYE